jgi:1,4-alpha-glucan branching enzyme
MLKGKLMKQYKLKVIFMSLRKQFYEKKPVCKVTFKLAKDITSSANRVNLAGDFNNWDKDSIPMKKLKSGEFSISVDLQKGREYQFKYLIDGCSWLNETEADKLVPNEFQSDNSVVIV